MAKKKIYAVRKGHKTGLFDSWAECQKATAGYSGAEFRGFTDREEALAFLKMETEKTVSIDKDREEKWVTGVWRAKTPLTSKYAAHMQAAGKELHISFCKVAAHTGNHYNEEADQLAKSALLHTEEEVRI